MPTTNAVSVHDSRILKRLVEAGIIPPQCRRWELRAVADHLFEMVSEVIVTSEQLEVIEKALLEHPEEANAVARTVFKALEKDADADLTFIGEQWTQAARERLSYADPEEEDMEAICKRLALA